LSLSCPARVVVRRHASPLPRRWEADAAKRGLRSRTHDMERAGKRKSQSCRRSTGDHEIERRTRPHSPHRAAELRFVRGCRRRTAR
jgi:hypothetical protein